MPPRSFWGMTDFFVTTSQRPTPELKLQAAALAAELGCTTEPRRKDGLEKLFARRPEAQRVLVVAAERWELISRDGWRFFHHPNLAAIRLKNLLGGKRDLLLDAAQLAPGDRVLDATLGLGGEATLCAWAVGDAGAVHGIEAIPELGVVVRNGLAHTKTESQTLNAAMRRVKVIHLGHHLEFLKTCPDDTYDVICFDPFFDVSLSPTENLGSLRAFGEHAPLLPETLTEARRVARKRIVVKSERFSSLLDSLEIPERVTSRQSKLVYGVIEIHQ
jgi:16S rRNA (guanine1516-N2)-methyltransferase